MVNFKYLTKTNHSIILATIILLMVALETYKIKQGLKVMQSANKLEAELKPYTIKLDPLKYSDFRLVFGANYESKNNNTQKTTTVAEVPVAKRNLVLKGIISTSNEENSAGKSVIIDHNGKTKVYSIGDSIPGGGYLYEINADHILIKTFNKLEKLALPSTIDPVAE